MVSPPPDFRSSSGARRRGCCGGFFDALHTTTAVDVPFSRERRRTSRERSPPLDEESGDGIGDGLRQGVDVVFFKRGAHDFATLARDLDVDVFFSRFALPFARFGAVRGEEREVVLRERDGCLRASGRVDGFRERGFVLAFPRRELLFRFGPLFPGPGKDRTFPLSRHDDGGAEEGRESLRLEVFGEGGLAEESLDGGETVLLGRATEFLRVIDVGLVGNDEDPLFGGKTSFVFVFFCHLSRNVHELYHLEHGVITHGSRRVAVFSPLADDAVRQSLVIFFAYGAPSRKKTLAHEESIGGCSLVRCAVRTRGLAAPFVRSDESFYRSDDTRVTVWVGVREEHTGGFIDFCVHGAGNRKKTKESADVRNNDAGKEMM